MTIVCSTERARRNGVRRFAIAYPNEIFFEPKRIGKGTGCQLRLCEPMGTQANEAFANGDSFYRRILQSTSNRVRNEWGC